MAKHFLTRVVHKSLIPGVLSSLLLLFGCAAPKTIEGLKSEPRRHWTLSYDQDLATVYDTLVTMLNRCNIKTRHEISDNDARISVNRKDTFPVLIEIKSLNSSLTQVDTYIGSMLWMDIPSRVHGWLDGSLEACRYPRETLYQELHDN